MEASDCLHDPRLKRQPLRVSTKTPFQPPRRRPSRGFTAALNTLSLSQVVWSPVLERVAVGGCSVALVVTMDWIAFPFFDLGSLVLICRAVL